MAGLKIRLARLSISQRFSVKDSVGKMKAELHIHDCFQVTLTIDIVMAVLDGVHSGIKSSR